MQLTTISARAILAAGGAVAAMSKRALLTATGARMLLVVGGAVAAISTRALLAACGAVAATGALAAEAPVIEMSIADIRTALLEDGVSCAAIIQSHLDRIGKYDRQLNSVIAVNPDALAAARALDALPRGAQRKLDLLCTPLLVKDNIDVAGMPTTAGSRLLADNVAPADAPTVAALRRAGAIPIAKTNMSEFAFNYKGASAVGGRTRNPYNILNSAGGSSSGNAAALAASFGVIALGTDTSGSLRVPAAVTGLVGLRPTHGTVDGRGVVPLSPSQDVVGPMCRSADDCLQVMRLIATPDAGAADEARSTPSLAETRIGVVRALFPEAPVYMREVDAFIERLRRAGITVQDVEIDDVQVLTGNIAPPGEQSKFASRSVFDFPPEFAAYLSGRRLAFNTYAEFELRLRALNAQGLEGDRVLADVASFGRNHEHRRDDDRYRINGAYRDVYVKARLDRALASFDFLMYPSVQGFNGTAANGPETGGTHRLSAYSGYPALAFPVGWAAPAAWAPLEPVGIELLGRRNDDLRLLKLLRQLEKQQAPRYTPPVMR
ncbi:amidase [Duganella sp. SAP-35]|uniref:Amidase n=2 Tax=Duganella aceris TaxID=2703883 RepID=A0ABX0FHH9_9BURK|nr:amidase [Duganella aceris]